VAPTTIVPPSKDDVGNQTSSTTLLSTPAQNEKSFDVRTIVLACVAAAASVGFVLLFFWRDKSPPELSGDKRVGQSGKPEERTNSILKFLNWNPSVTNVVPASTPAKTRELQRITDTVVEPLEEPSIPEHSIMYTTPERWALKNLDYPPSMSSGMGGASMADFSVSGVSWPSSRLDDSGIYQEPGTYKETGMFGASEILRDFTITYKESGISDSQVSEIYGTSGKILDSGIMTDSSEWNGDTVHPGV